MSRLFGYVLALARLLSYPRLFLSYRRLDSGPSARSIWEHLVRSYGPRRVFMDLSSIEGGDDFVVAIQDQIPHAAAVIVVIGKTWLTCGDDAGRRRLDIEDDPVRMEITATFEHGVRVYPVLVDDARMPAADALPAPLRALARRNAIPLSSERWEYDIGRLVGAIDAQLSVAARTRVLLYRHRHLFPAAAAIVAVALGLPVLASFWAVGQPPAPPWLGAPTPSPVAAPPLTVMSGVFNIALTQFGRLDADGHPISWDLGPRFATGVFAPFRDELQLIVDRESLPIDWRDPSQIGRVDGPDATTRRQAIEDLASRIRAQVIVHGNVTVGDNRSTFLSDVYLAPSTIQDAEELAGHYGFDVRVSSDIDQDPVAFPQLQGLVADRAKGLTHFIVGFHYLAHDQLDQAEDHFRTAERDWKGAPGSEILYLFLGHVAGRRADLAAGAQDRQARLEAAAEQYQRALAVNPEYPRALLGRGEVRLQQSRGVCDGGSTDPGFSAAGLREALSDFERAGAVGDSGSSPNIAAKVAWFKGRAHVCLSQAGVGDYWHEAEGEFGEVIHAFDDHNESLRELAATAYALLADIYAPFVGDPPDVAAAAAAKAAASDEKAAEVTAHDDRRAQFLACAQAFYQQAGQPDRAADAYARARRFDPRPTCQSR